MTFKHEDVIGKTPEQLLAILESEGPPFDPFSMAKKLGIKVDLSFNFDHMNELGFIRKNGQNVIIWINPMSTPDVQRFIVAHEIAHFIEHVNVSDTEVMLHFPSEVRDDVNSRELAADEYATKLLMPENEVLKQADRLLSIPDVTGGELVGVIAWKFQVPEKIAFNRLKDLGYTFD